ncbi:nucleotidyltransferase [Bradyrhizobium sp. TZ2]
MAIAESQLTTWSSQGSVKQSRDTYISVKVVLEDSKAPYFSKTCESFLQGSYGNDTNVYADSDVDVVMRLDSVFYYDLSRMTDSERDAYDKNFGDGKYSVGEFKTEVLGWLKKNYDESVKPGKKALFIPGSGNRRDTDVLVCAQFRRYHKFAGPNDQKYDQGICFFLPDGTRIENFPEQHSDNCTAKHKDTKQWFKPTVRVFKNMRNRMIERGELAEGVAPSYYLEECFITYRPTSSVVLIRTRSPTATIGSCKRTALSLSARTTCTGLSGIISIPRGPWPISTRT